MAPIKIIGINPLLYCMRQPQHCGTSNIKVSLEDRTYSPRNHTKSHTAYFPNYTVITDYVPKCSYPKIVKYQYNANAFVYQETALKYIKS